MLKMPGTMREKMHNIIEDKILEHRQRQHQIEGAYLGSEYVKYFECAKCKNIVSLAIEQMPDYFLDNWHEFRTALEFIFFNEFERFKCPVCQAEIENDHLCFAHFIYLVYPYDKELIIELSKKRDSAEWAYAFVDFEGNHTDSKNIGVIKKCLFHPSRNYFQKGLNELKNKDIKAAFAFFKKALHSFPRWQEAQMELARCYLLLGKEVQGEKIIRSILKKNPENIKALLMKGWLAYKCDRFDEAVKIFHKIIAINAQVAQAFYYLALISLEQGNIEETLHFIKKTQDLEPEHEDASKLYYLIMKDQQHH